MLNSPQEALLAIIQRTLWSKDIPVENADWGKIERLAKQQGVLWMLYPGMKNNKNCIPAELFKEWRSVTHSGVLYNEQLNDFQSELLAWLDGRGIRAAILKGTSCSRYYPYPSIRPLGDIDILVDQENMSILAEYLTFSGFCSSNIQHGFHIGYYRDEITVEVHYRCSELPENSGTRAVIAAENGFLDSIEFAKYDGLTFPVLSESNQALMLLMHMERHMQEDGIGLRQLCDWAMFVYGSNPEHWKETIPLFKSCGVFMYAEILTAVCIKYLGMDSSYASWVSEVSEKIAIDMIEDIFRGGNMGDADAQNAGSLFTDRSLMGTQTFWGLNGMFAKMRNLAYRKWPIVQRHRILLPVFYLYIPLIYVIHSLARKNAKRNVFSAIKISSRRKRLYNALHLYEV